MSSGFAFVHVHIIPLRERQAVGPSSLLSVHTPAGLGWHTVWKPLLLFKCLQFSSRACSVFRNYAMQSWSLGKGLSMNFYLRSQTQVLANYFFVFSPLQTIKVSNQISHIYVKRFTVSINSKTFSMFLNEARHFINFFPYVDFEISTVGSVP